VLDFKSYCCRMTYYHHQFFFLFYIGFSCTCIGYVVKNMVRLLSYLQDKNHFVVLHVTSRRDFCMQEVFSPNLIF
jgi:hypothetical protein